MTQRYRRRSSCGCG